MYVRLISYCDGHIILNLTMTQHKLWSCQSLVFYLIPLENLGNVYMFKFNLIKFYQQNVNSAIIWWQFQVSYVKFFWSTMDGFFFPCLCQVTHIFKHLSCTFCTMTTIQTLWKLFDNVDQAEQTLDCTNICGPIKKNIDTVHIFRTFDVGPLKPTQCPYQMYWTLN